ncbi:hypothetical protein [Streptomyces sp. uw30]|uniref:hypothetical protein n=1 Tax=Streptomyces sp. uw30 TaxID=1828179 RepID=UPI001650D712|nr:hypothetical protein [Streptomyces sp. uw30]
MDLTAALATHRLVAIVRGDDADAARVPPSGEVRWRLTITGACRCPATSAPKEHRPWT